MAANTAYKDIMREYEYAQNAALALREQRQQVVYKTLPRVHTIEKEMAQIGLSLAKLALAGGVGLKDIRAKYEALEREKAKLLESEGIPEDYLTDVYHCEICADTGFVNRDTAKPLPCTCLKQRMIDKYYYLSSLKNVLERENFDTFKLNYFSQVKIPDEGLSPRDNMKAMRRISERFANFFTPGAENLLFHGATGLGKTFVCHCIAKAVLDAGFTVLYITAPRLFKLVQAQHFSRDNAADAAVQLDAVQDVDLLILDDLGSEFATVVTDSALFEVVNQRLLDRRSTVISTNLTVDELENQYTERIVSRMKGHYKVLKFFGEDIRVKKKHGQCEGT